MKGIAKRICSDCGRYEWEHSPVEDIPCGHHETPEDKAARLVARGYRRVSNKYRIVARIDRPDWLTVLATSLRRAPADFYVPGEKNPSGSWCDHYRRVHSKDHIESVDEATFKLIPPSDHNDVGYIPLDGDAPASVNPRFDAKRWNSFSDGARLTLATQLAEQVWKLKAECDVLQADNDRLRAALDRALDIADNLATMGNVGIFDDTLSKLRVAKAKENKCVHSHKDVV